MPPDISRARAVDRLISVLIAATLAVVVAGSSSAGMTLVWSSFSWTAAACAICAGLGLFYRRGRPDERLSTTLIALWQIIAFSAIGLLLSYVFASFGGPLWDATLYRWDLALGLDWRAYLAFVNDHPRLGWILSQSYGSLMLQMVVVVVALGLTGRGTQLRRFVLAYALSGIITVTISAAMPATPMFVHLGLEPADYPNLVPAAGFAHVRDLEALRSGALKVLSIHCEGIIAFPSFHAALAILFMVSLWSCPWLRWPGVALNLVMLASTPIDGGHYFVDVMAGMAVAALTLVAAGTALRVPSRFRLPRDMREDSAVAVQHA